MTIHKRLFKIVGAWRLLSGRFLISTCLAGALFAAPLQANDVVQTEGGKAFQIRLWTTAEQTRLVIESAKPVDYKTFWLTKPSRLVLDVGDSEHAADFLARSNIKNAPYLHAARSARYDANTIRFVFEPAADIVYEKRVLKPVAGYGHRLILDIAPQNRPDPLRQLIESFNEAPAARPFLAVIDPGHGGEDPGAVSRNRKLEKDVVLQIALRIQKEVNARPGMRAVLTRKDDRFLPLAKRVLFAQRLKADAFISVHADSVESPKAMGSSVYVLSRRGASSRLARRLAQHANLADLVGGAAAAADLGTALQADEARHIIGDGKERDSQRLAKLLASKISRVNTMHKKHVESAGFAVLKSPDIPSVLVETAFISNPSEERKLLNAQFQQKMAKAVADGLWEYQQRYTVSE